jgi:hypothetical protein
MSTKADSSLLLSAQLRFGELGMTILKGIIGAAEAAQFKAGVFKSG